MNAGDVLTWAPMRGIRKPRRLWLIAALALAVVLTAPLLLVDVPPVLDYPNHLARMFVLAHPHDAALSQMYAPHWRLVPNLGIDVIGTGLLKLTEVHTGGRILLALSLLAPVIGVTLYHRVVFGCASLWPLASGLVACSAVFLLGFMNFLLALGLAFAGAAGWIALRRRVALYWVAVAGAATAAATFLCHIFGVALLALLIVSEEAARLYRLRGAGRPVMHEATRVGGALIVMLAPALLFYLASPLSDTPALPGRWRGWDKLLAVMSPFMTTNVDLSMLTLLGFVAFLLLTWRSMAVAPAFPLSLFTLVVVFLVAPSTIKGGTFVDIRLMLMIVLLVFAGSSPRLRHGPAMLAVSFFVVLIVVRTGHLAWSWTGHRADLADVRAAIADVAPGTKVLVARGHRGNDTETTVPTRALPGVYRLDGHLGALLAIERKAFWPLMFADPAQQPVEVRPPYRAIAQSPGEPIDLPVLQGDDREAPSYIRNWRSKFAQVLLIDPPSPLPVIDGLSPVHVGTYAVQYRVVPRP
ncbi:hypothetical protein [Rhodopseudomonas boonkerdii]|uniref:hypothetical protein n=1 Tax=Rhodopseudomonas boonkerdii TaxID=475937 RepID=UPI001E653AF9|nr:hypothetical protein [Rhodopseudomonas boonkerdii]